MTTHLYSKVINGCWECPHFQYIARYTEKLTGVTPYCLAMGAPKIIPTEK